MTPMLLVASVAALFIGRLSLAGGQPRRIAFMLGCGLGPVLLVAALCFDLWSHWHAGLRPSANGHAALIYANGLLQLQLAAAVLIMGLFAIARLLAGKLDSVRRVCFDNLALLWAYTLGQAALGLLITRGFPLLVG